METGKNPVLDFDWERDIAKARPPYKGVVQPVEKQALIESLRWGTTRNAHWQVQTDPSDEIVLANTEGKRYMHALIWKETLDKYLLQYYHLKISNSSHEIYNDWKVVALPDKIIPKLEKHEKARKKGTEKYIPVNTDYLQFIPKAENYNSYKTPAIGHACYLNLLCRYLDTTKKASQKMLLPQYDGSKYQVDGDDPLPQFELIDFLIHEDLTAISLTIEIASIFVEVRAMHPDYVMWDKAFEVFSQRMLPIIVRSKLFFTRICVARHFFNKSWLRKHWNHMSGIRNRWIMGQHLNAGNF